MNNWSQLNTQQDEVDSLTQRGKADSFFYHMSCCGRFSVDTECRSTPKFWNALMKNRCIISPEAIMLVLKTHRLVIFFLLVPSPPHLGSVSTNYYSSPLCCFLEISCHYSESGMVSGLQVQKEMYMICIFLEHTIQPVHTVAAYRCQKELAIKLILEGHQNEEQNGGLP